MTDLSGCCNSQETVSIPCLNNALQPMAALAQVVDSPEELTPVFYTGNQCQSIVFPNRLKAVNTTVAPSLTTEWLSEQFGANFLRIMPKYDFDLVVKSSATLGSANFNFLIGATGVKHSFTQFDTTSKDTSQFFTNPISSLYIPPNYEAYFFPQDPRYTAISAQMRNALRLGPGTLLTHTCCQGTRWGQANEYSFLTTTLTTPQPSLAAKDCCQYPAGTIHGAPYLVIVKLEELHDLILDSCSKNRSIMIGPYDMPVWKPQTSGCDSFMTSVCNQAEATMTDDIKDICSCFIQQRSLDAAYGAVAKVPVLCFGADAQNRVEKNCVFNSKSYKTFDMQQSSCSFAECIQLKDSLPASTSGMVVCDGSLFPPALPTVQVTVTVSVSPDTDDDYTESTVTSVPTWIWVLFAISIVILISFLIGLTLVTPNPAPQKEVPTLR